MSFFDKLTALLPIGKKKAITEYFFALNIANETVTAALWQLDGKQLKILETASANFSLDDLAAVTDKLLDTVLGIREIEPQKILFGVPSTWLKDENLKDENLKILRNLVKELELTPMAYVERANALVHLMEKSEGVPPTAILVGFESTHLTVIVVRAGKLDGVKVVSRGDSSGTDIEKALLTFTDVETLPSKILIYGKEAAELKSQLISFHWMSKLSFLHFPKIDILEDDVEIKSVCLAGASELEENVVYKFNTTLQKSTKPSLLSLNDSPSQKDSVSSSAAPHFIAGDISEQTQQDEEAETSTQDLLNTPEVNDTEELMVERELISSNQTDLTTEEKSVEKPDKISFAIKKSKKVTFSLVAILLVILTSSLAFLFLPKAEIKIFVEPRVLEKDTTVVADPNQKLVDEMAKIIPGQLVNTEVSGNLKDKATGSKQIGDPAKGTVIIYNKTYESKQLSKGTTFTSSGGLKFTLDTSINIASQSASDSGIAYGKGNGAVTASVIGADSNLPSGSELTVGNFSSNQVSAKAEGNFSGGTSKSVVVVSSEDQSRLLAALSSKLKSEAQQKLQESLNDKKILEEALSEEIVKKAFNKNINDQASEFSLNLTAKYKGTAFADKDLKLIVSKLINTDVPEGFELNLEDTETQADVSKAEKDGKLIFLARFKAKLMPKIDENKIKNQIKGKSVSHAEEEIRRMENILGSEIKITPQLPKLIQRIPLTDTNIKIEVGLK